MSDAEPPIYTRVGHTGATELRFWGNRVFADLLGKTSVAQLLMCSLTGRVFDHADERVIDDIMTAMSSVDPRLWPFKITRLGAAFGSAELAVAITLVASHGAIFGARRFREITDVLVDLEQRRLGDAELEAVLRAGTVGFGILYGRHDARFDALVGALAARGRTGGRYMQTALQAVAIARGRMNVEPHVFVAIAAICLDLGMTPEQIAEFGMLPLFADALGNAAEGAQQRSEALRLLKPHQVNYVGPGPRMSPRRR